jgi:hypothetical protein
MLQRVDEAFPWLPGEIRDDCAIDAVDSMAAQCGRDRAEIEALVAEAERARASHESEFAV